MTCPRSDFLPHSRAKSLESEHRLAQVIGQMVRAAQQDGEAIARSIIREIFFRYGRMPLQPIGPRHFFKPLPQFSINDVPCPGEPVRAKECRPATCRD